MDAQELYRKLDERVDKQGEKIAVIYERTNHLTDGQADLKVALKDALKELGKIKDAGTRRLWAILSAIIVATLLQLFTPFIQR